MKQSTTNESDSTFINILSQADCIPATPATPVERCSRKGGSGMDITEATDYLRDKSKSKSSGKCAAFVRRAIEAGGVPLDPGTRPISAKNYGPYLKNHGFYEVNKDGYVPQRGDVVVIQNYAGGSEHGHIAMYDGSNWISDYSQRDMWGGEGYRKHQPDYAIYRP